MIWFIFALIAVILAVLESNWAVYALKALHFKGELDRTVAEPGEVVTWRSTVGNHSRLPIPFVRLKEKFPLEAEIFARETWLNAHRSRVVTQWHVEDKMSLRPRQSNTRLVHFALPRRGCYRFSEYELSAGDLLGFQEASKHGGWQEIVIIPEHSRQQTSLDALGGFLGDISVRRFILEDPILTLGFRDYTGREPMKAISWTRTAATGSLQVKQYDHTAERHVMILLNTEGASAEELEECLRLVRTACEKLEQQKIPYGFRTNGNLPCPVGKIFSVAEGLGYRHVTTILYGLGKADRTCFYSFRYLTEQTLKHRRSNESYIVVTPPPEGVTAACLRKLESAVGNNLCVLIAREEARE